MAASIKEPDRHLGNLCKPKLLCNNSNSSWYCVDNNQAHSSIMYSWYDKMLWRSILGKKEISHAVGLCPHCVGQLFVLSRGEQKTYTHPILRSTRKLGSQMVQGWTVPSLWSLLWTWWCRGQSTIQDHWSARVTKRSCSGRIGWLGKDIFFLLSPRPKWAVKLCSSGKAPLHEKTFFAQRWGLKCNCRQHK